MQEPVSTPIHPYNYRRQILVVSAVLFSMIVVAGIFTSMIWYSLCHSKLLTCFSEPERISLATYALLATIRSFTLLPQSFFWVMTAEAFFFDHSIITSIQGVMMLCLSSITSFAIAYFLGKFIHTHVVSPWLLTHAPRNVKKAQRKAYHLTLLSRSFVFLHFDGLSFFYGLLGLKFQPTMKGTFIIEVIKVFVFVILLAIGQDPIQAMILTIITTTTTTVGYLILGQTISYFLGCSWLKRCLSVYHDTFCEIQTNNDVQTKDSFQGEKPPVLLLYGFFASRRTLTMMEKLLQQKGYEVFSLNLGGLFGVFFTNNIIDTARFVDHRLKAMLANKNHKKIHIVAHSKGGLVATWLALRLGGHRYCHKIITMGTPFGGTYYSWLALITPLGLLWQDVWQMRPRSQLLTALENAVIPPSLKIYCFYSKKDRIAPNVCGILQSKYGDTDNVVPIAMNHYSHFEYLYKKAVIEKIHHILSKPE
ncbi:MAG: alpha/beta fold hydrolase [Proteobacteria bacterium]|nr:alpha/beta fold hydrolase [Pseudomonadota bacterium]